MCGETKPFASDEQVKFTMTRLSILTLFSQLLLVNSERESSLDSTRQNTMATAAISTQRTEARKKDDCRKNNATGSSCRDTTYQQPIAHSSFDSCGVYFAPSTIPGAGMGMFAGRNFHKGETVTPGDIVIPLIDWNTHNADMSMGYSAMSAYYWERYEVNRMTAESVHSLAFAPGIGAAANCFFPLVNVQGDDGTTELSNDGLHRSKDPGTGAFTPYHGRTGYALREITAGEELFLDYGDSYFTDRSYLYGKMPVAQSYKEADELLKNYTRLRDELLFELGEGGSVQSNFHTAWYGLMNTLGSVWTSRTLNALPEDPQLVDEISTIGTSMLHYNRSIQSLDWLGDHGLCMDHLMPGPSTIPQAGRGAFARRFLPQESVIAPAPLIHLDRQIFDMFPTVYVGKKGERLWANVTKSAVHTQILLNYCFGHAQTDVVLCPYGVLTGLINHAPSPDQVNAKVVWNRKWTNQVLLEQSSEEWLWNNTSVGLYFDFVATRDIYPGEEILIDYGSDWEAAWIRHVHSWNPPPRAESYISASELNDDSDLIIRTMSEGSYGTDHVQLFCLELFRRLNGLEKDLESELHTCRVVARYGRGDGQTRYVAEIITYTTNEKNETCFEEFDEVLWDLSRDSFYFEDAPYSRDTHQPWTFRFMMGIPDEILPDAWILEV